MFCEAYQGFLQEFYGLFHRGFYTGSTRAWEKDLVVQGSSLQVLFCAVPSVAT